MIAPCLCYRDARGALDFLSTAFGFEQRALHEGEDGSVAHAELALGGGLVMLASAGASRITWPAGAACTYVALDSVDEHCERARAAGAEIVMEPTDQDYGSRDYVARDPEGNLWSFGTYRPEP